MFALLWCYKEGGYILRERERELWLIYIELVDNLALCLSPVHGLIITILPLKTSNRLGNIQNTKLYAVL